VFPAKSPLDTAAAFVTLLAKIRSGDLASAGELEAMFMPGLRTMLRFRVPQAEIEEKARKILHEVLARLFLDTPAVTHDQLLGLICDTMHRLAPGTGEPPSSSTIDSRSAAQVLKALVRTTPQERKVLQRYYLDGRTIPQIAGELQLGETFIRELIIRLKVDLRSWVDRH
jgi:DNA-directed RNA polymerase specialized sigma24 family protein